jgi:hypothetical protein
VESGGAELAKKLEKEGYVPYEPEMPACGTDPDVVKESAASTSTAANPDEAKDCFFKSGRGLSHELVGRSPSTRTSRTGCASSGTGLDYFLARPLPRWGGNLNDIDFENIFYYIKPTENQGEVVGGSAGRHPGHLGQAGHPGGGEKYLAGVGAQAGRSRLPQASGS